MSVSRCLQLLDWAHRQNAWIVEDDYDSEYRYESMPIASLQGLDRGGRVVYTGTFSKTLFPSLRLGYMVIPSSLVDRFAAVRRATDFCPSHFHQATLADFIEEGHFGRHIRKTRLLYAERRGALVEAIRNAFGDEFSARKPACTWWSRCPKAYPITRFRSAPPSKIFGCGRCRHAT